jgi:hypothetical protein
MSLGWTVAQTLPKLYYHYRIIISYILQIYLHQWRVVWYPNASAGPKIILVCILRVRAVILETNLSPFGMYVYTP